MEVENLEIVATCTTEKETGGGTSVDMLTEIAEHILSKY